MKMHLQTSLLGYMSILCSFVFIVSALGVSGDGSIVLPYTELLNKSVEFIRFDISVLNELCNQSLNQNVVISPVSIKSLLALLAETYEGNEMEKLRNQSAEGLQATSFLLMSEVQNLLKNPDSKIAIQSQNKIYETLDSQAIGREKYNEHVQYVNFSDPSVVDEINKWVADATHGLITSVVEPGQLPENTKRFLLNCIYLKANWSVPFDPSRSMDHFFYDFEGKNHTERFMYTTERYLNYADLNDYRSIMFEIPFVDPRYTITFILPGSDVSVYEVLTQLQNRNLLNVFSRMKNESCNLMLPVLSLDFTATGLLDTLKQDKITSFFGPNPLLDQFLKEKVLRTVGTVLHEAKIELNEEGVEAAAVSGGIGYRSSISKEKEIIVDHPFIFFLRDKVTGLILYEGVRVV